MQKRSGSLFSDCIGDHTILMTPRGKCKFLLWLPSRRAVAFIAKDSTVYILAGNDFKRVLAAEHKRAQEAGKALPGIPSYVLAERTRGQEIDDWQALSKHLLDNFTKVMAGASWP